MSLIWAGIGLVNDQISFPDIITLWLHTPWSLCFSMKVALQPCSNIKYLNRVYRECLIKILEYSSENRVQISIKFETVANSSNHSTTFRSSYTFYVIEKVLCCYSERKQKRKQIQANILQVTKCWWNIMFASLFFINRRILILPCKLSAKFAK